MGSNWIYRPRDVLDANSPSRLDGISAEREEAKRMAYTELLRDCGEAMKIAIPTVATAVVFCHHYYASCSMRTSDTWVMATACLFLACKVQEAPRALKDVILGMYSMRFRGRIPELKLISDREWQDGVKAAVLKAERALLYVICFDFQVSLPYQPALQYIKEFGLAEENAEIMQTAWDMVTLSLHTTLSLQLKPEKIAVAAVFLATKVHRMKTKTRGGRRWYLLPPVNVRPDLMEVAVAQLLEVSEKLRRFQAKRAAPDKLAALLLQQQQQGGGAAAEPPAASSPAAAGDDAAAELEGGALADSPIAAAEAGAQGHRVPDVTMEDAAAG